MDGLDFQEINKSELENEFTIGAEYYGKKYVESVSVVKRQAKTIPLGQMWVLATDGDHGSPDYQESGVLYLLSECVKEGYIEKSKCRYITEAKNRELKRSCLHPGDIVVTKTGVYFGKSAVIPESIPEANTIAHVGKITLKPQYNPYYVSTFLNCKYGYYQLRRRGIKATRPEIKLVEFPDIIVPEFSKGLYSAIESTVQTANALYDEAGNVINQSEQMLMQILGIPQITDTAVSIKNFSQSFGKTGRFDAEYYQSKYEKYTEALNTKDTVDTLCILYDRNFIPEAEVEYTYIELASIGCAGAIVNAERNLGSALPTRARRQVNAGQVIISSIEGSLQSCALITSEFDKSLCSTGFYVIDSENINSETLLVLFKCELMQALMKQRCSGSILAGITKDELLSMPLPRIDENVQREIAVKVRQSFELRDKSKQLLENAKQAVELAIEQGEDAALAWLKDKVK